jgi:hypothetical protein
MNSRYTDQDINLFYERFKLLPEYFELERVRQLVNNPDAKAMHSVKIKYKPSKFIIMTSAFIVGVAAVIILLTPKNTNQDQVSLNNIQIETENPMPVIENNQNEIQTETLESQNYPTKEPILKIKDLSIIERTPNPPEPKTALENQQSSNLQIVIPQDSGYPFNWPCDTMIDRETMLIKLSLEELLEIGIIVKNGKSHYHNITPNEHHDWEYTNLPESERITTHNDYYSWAISSLSCDEYTLGSPDFYSVIDTLVPIIVEAEKTKIYWFTPTQSLFDILPARYSNIQETINNLRYLKKTCLQKSFINYWTQGESIFDEINLLELTKDELRRLNFKISEDMLVISGENDINRIELHSNSGSYIKGNSDSMDYPPNPFPMVITDTIGRRRYIAGVDANRESVNRDYLLANMNTLIPIKVRLSEIIPPRNETLVFWFYPTDEFIDALPDEIKDDLRSELDAINKGTAGNTKCTYFEVCKSTLFLEDIKVYPNPANQVVTISFSLQESIEGRISLVNISGVQVKELVSKSIFNSGFNSFTTDLSDISPGIYLISIISEKGFKTQRVIISR